MPAHGGVADEAVLLAMGAADADGQLVLYDRGGHGAGHQPAIVRAGIAGRAARLEIIAGLAGDDVDRAAQRILAIKRPLRPAQHLDPLDIEQRVVEIGGVGPIDAVDEEAHARLHRLHQRDADAADRHEGASRTIAGDIEAGRQSSGFTDTVDILPCKGVAADRGHRDRHVQQRFLSLARGDDDIGIAICRGGWRALRLGCGGQGRGDRDTGK